MEPVSDHLSDQGGVAAGAIVDNKVHLDLVFYSLVHDLNGIHDHLRVKHAADHFVKREGFGLGFLIAHPKGSDEPDDHLASRVEKLRSYLGELLPQRRQPGPVGKYHPYPMPFQDLEYRVCQICVGPKLDVVPGILGNLGKEIIQILGQSCDRDPVILDVVFLLEDESIQAGAEDVNSRLIELLHENIRVQVICILDLTRPPLQFPGDYDLRDLEKKKVAFLHVLPVFL